MANNNIKQKDLTPATDINDADGFSGGDGNTSSFRFSWALVKTKLSEKFALKSEVADAKNVKVDIYNYEATELKIGEIVYSLGGQYVSGSLFVAVQRAQADLDLSTFEIFIVSENIASGETGVALRFGIVNVLSLGLTIPFGTPLYLSPTTPGLITSTKPSNPDLVHRLGRVLTITAPSGTTTSVLFDPTYISSASGSTSKRTGHFPFALTDVVSNSQQAFYWARSAGADNSAEKRSINIYNDGLDNSNSVAPCQAPFSGEITRAVLTIRSAGVQSGSVVYPVTYSAEIRKINWSGASTLLGVLEFPITSGVGSYNPNSDTRAVIELTDTEINLTSGDLFGIRFVAGSGSSEVAYMKNAFIDLQISEG